MLDVAKQNNVAVDVIDQKKHLNNVKVIYKAWLGKGVSPSCDLYSKLEG